MTPHVLDGRAVLVRDLQVAHAHELRLVLAVKRTIAYEKTQIGLLDLFGLFAMRYGHVHYFVPFRSILFGIHK